MTLSAQLYSRVAYTSFQRVYHPSVILYDTLETIVRGEKQRLLL